MSILAYYIIVGISNKSMTLNNYYNNGYIVFDFHLFSKTDSTRSTLSIITNRMYPDTSYLSLLIMLNKYFWKKKVMNY